MIDEVFVDGVRGAGFSQGAVRIAFHSLVHDAQVRKEPRVRLIMTTEGFLDVYAKLTEIVEQLRKTGQGGASNQSGSGEPGPERISPNF